MYFVNIDVALEKDILYYIDQQIARHFVHLSECLNYPPSLLNDSNKYFCSSVEFLLKDRFYTRGTLTSIRIHRLAKIPTLYRDWLKSLPFIVIG